jgi:hypothetical protein
MGAGVELDPILAAWILYDEDDGTTKDRRLGECVGLDEVVKLGTFEG